MSTTSMLATNMSATNMLATNSLATNTLEHTPVTIRGAGRRRRTGSPGIKDVSKGVRKGVQTIHKIDRSICIYVDII